jgi:hypothetical protein
VREVVGRTILLMMLVAACGARTLDGSTTMPARDAEAALDDDAQAGATDAGGPGHPWDAGSVEVADGAATLPEAAAKIEAGLDAGVVTDAGSE